MILLKSSQLRPAQTALESNQLSEVAIQRAFTVQAAIHHSGPKDRRDF
jgi:hypothetical protein